MCATCDPIICVLDVIQSVFVGFPHFNPCVRNRVTVGVLSSPFPPAWLPWCTSSNISTDWDLWGVINKEWTKYSGLCSVAVGCVVDIDRLHRDPQNVREQYKLLTPVVSDVTYRRKKFNRLVPLFFSQPYVSDEGMQMSY